MAKITDFFVNKGQNAVKILYNSRF